MFAEPIHKLIGAFTKLPGVGPKTAERFVMFLLKSGRGEVSRLQRALEDLLQQIKSCEICHHFSDQSPCEYCSDPKRDKTTICVVAESQDIIAIEKTGTYKGVYHVLRGLIDPLVDVGPRHLKIEELIARIKNPAQPVKEVIFAFDPTIEGETTIQYISKLLAGTGVTMSRLATGIPSGGSIEYADEITLGSALTARRQVK